MSAYKYLLEFSGGRDSLALLKFWEPWKDETLVIWIDAGAALPELESIVLKAVEGWNFVRWKTDAAAYIEKNGIPVDVVPVWRNGYAAACAGNEEKPKFNSCFACCYANRMKPMHEFAVCSGIKTVLRGQRNTEKLKGPARSGDVEDGITYLFPLENWSDEQVNQFLGELPPWYIGGDKGMDCWFCTGYAKESVGLWAYLKEHHPEKYGIVMQRFDSYKRALQDEVVFPKEITND